MNPAEQAWSMANSAQIAYATLERAEAHSSAEGAQALRDEAVKRLNLCRAPDDQDMTDAERAFIGAGWIRAGVITRGLPYLDHDWTHAEPEPAGLAGTALMSMGAIAPAMSALQRAAQGKKVSPAIRINLGRALMMLGHSDEALHHLEQGRKDLGERNTLATLSLAEALLVQGRAQEALDLVPETLEDEHLVSTRVRLLGAAGQYEEAIRLLRQAREKMSDSKPLLLLSAEFAELRGRNGEAVFMLRKALENDPDNVELLVSLAFHGNKGKLSAIARSAADRALELSADRGPQVRALAMNIHAQLLVEDGKMTEAEDVYREALQLAPGMVAIKSGLGQLLMQNGRVNEALELFYQVRALAPLQGWSQLIHAREVPDDPKVLADLERAARQPGLAGVARTSLLFTVAAAWDKKNEHDRAMTLAREANEASKKLLNYAPAKHRLRIEREICCFSRPFMDRRQGWGNPSRLPVFVLGMPRSGTTLTEQILGSHSLVFGAGELSLVGEQIGILNSWEHRIGSRLHYPECVADLSQERSARIAANWLAKLQEFDPCARHVVDKLPHNFEHIGLIKLLFPNAIIFHCRREARDIAVSNYITDFAAKFGGMGFAYDLGWIGEQLVDHDRLMQHWNETFPGQIMEVVYEDLVEDTEGWARKMIDFMGLDWEEGVMSFQSLERAVKTASVWQVRQPVYTTSKARWKRYADHLGPLEEALKVRPPMPVAQPVPEVEPGLFQIGMAKLREGQPAEAESCFQKVLANYPQHAAAHHFLGAALLQLGHTAPALQAMRQAVKLLPIHATWFENLARAEHAAGNTENAQKAWSYGQRLRKCQTDAANALSLPASANTSANVQSLMPDA